MFPESSRPKIPAARWSLVAAAVAALSIAVYFWHAGDGPAADDPNATGRANPAPPGAERASVAESTEGLTPARVAALGKYYRDAAARAREMRQEIDRRIAKDPPVVNATFQRLLSVIGLTVPNINPLMATDPEISRVLREQLKNEQFFTEVKSQMLRSANGMALHHDVTNASTPDQLLELAIKLAPENEELFVQSTAAIPDARSLAPIVRGFVDATATAKLIADYMAAQGYIFDEGQQAFLPKHLASPPK